jgi:hypothetical protein
MEPSTKASGLTIELMAKGKLLTRVGIPIRVIGKMTKLMEKGSTLARMGLATRENGETTYRTGKVQKPGLIKLYSVEISLMDRKLERARSNFLTVGYSRENFPTT